jgi:hypothetical protein
MHRAEHLRADGVSLVGVSHLQDSKVAALAEGSTADPFSKAFDVNAKQALKKGEWHKGLIATTPSLTSGQVIRRWFCVLNLVSSTGDDGYGRPAPGSLTEERGKEAVSHVDLQVDQLVEVIR